MEADKYLQLTRKRQPKAKPRNKPLPKANEKYLEAFEDIERALQILDIKYEKLFQFESTKHWRFDFHIVKLRLLIEIEGGPWSGGRCGLLSNKAWSLDRYDHVVDLGFKIERLHPDSILFGYAIDWIKGLLERIEYEPDPTISTNRID
ncbi:Uncharacterised protein [Acinetobacter junii]|uniref:hypothetical protein n=1 Tax=Acinetobacter junii TaxID=40215 RepID=UPI00195B4172|nr:hypothetical protein [Acinetobacter junii]VTX53940.1 Uncharacterised protein [Acinetobacter junii]